MGKEEAIGRVHKRRQQRWHKQLRRRSTETLKTVFQEWIQLALLKLHDEKPSRILQLSSFPRRMPMSIQ
jgi:hypothetical protein